MHQLTPNDYQFVLLLQDAVVDQKREKPLLGLFPVLQSVLYQSTTLQKYLSNSKVSPEEKGRSLCLLEPDC